MTVSKDMIRLTTTITKDLDTKMQQSMQVNGYKSKSNFIRSAVEEKLKNNIDDGSDTTFVSKHVVANQYRLLNEKLENEIEKLQKTIDEKNKQVELLNGILGIVIFSELKNQSMKINEATINKLSIEIFNLINSEDGITTSSVTKLMKKILNGSKEIDNGKTVNRKDNPNSNGVLVGVYDFGFGSNSSSGTQTKFNTNKDDKTGTNISGSSIKNPALVSTELNGNEKNLSDSSEAERNFDDQDEKQDDDPEIYYTISVDDFHPARITDDALREAAEKVNEITNPRKQNEFKREVVLYETAMQNPMARKILNNDYSLRNRSAEDQKKFDDFRKLHIYCIFDARYMTDFITSDDGMPDEVVPLAGLHSKVLALLDTWCDDQGHFIDATKHQNFRNY